MDETAYRFAVETTAEIEVLRTTMKAIIAHLIGRLPEDGRDLVLRGIEDSASRLPAHHGGSEEVRSFYEAVAEAAPQRARAFVDELRQVLDRGHPQPPSEREGSAASRSILRGDAER